VLYEVREYVAVPGRLPALLALFNEHTRPLLAEHGMELVTAGMTTVGENSFNELVYTMRFADMGELERKWAEFLADPRWVAAAGASTVDGPVITSMRRRFLAADPVA
jgi:hypothetical protein